MRLLLVVLCLLAVVYSQTQHKNGNPTGEIGQPAFDEIIVESTLTVRGKSGARSGKSLATNPKPIETGTEEDKKSNDGATVQLRRSRRDYKPKFGVLKRRGFFPSEPAKNSFPSSSSSSSFASSNAFNSNTPFGSFGASASQSASQSQAFGPNGFSAAAGQSASQSYLLPNGSRIDVSFSHSYSFENGKPTSANSNAITITHPDGTKTRLNRRR